MLDISSIPVMIVVRLGDRKISLKELLSANAGSIIELNHQVGQNFELYVNEKLFGYGELVILNDDRKGIRITQIIK